MTDRRTFFQSAAGLGLAAAAQAAPQPVPAGRQYWLDVLDRLAAPVLRNLAAGTLKREMPVECVTGNPTDRRKYSHLEAFGRLLAGIAPWLEVQLDPGPERDLQQRYRTLARDAMRSATDPASPDFLNFHEGAQPLVDCGFLAQAILRAPQELGPNSIPAVRKNLAAALLSSRVITPGFNNWLLFAATVEAALATMGERWDNMRIDYAVRQHQQWYLGDGVYGDGPHFHFDYYNSFVIQPMLIDVLRAMRPHAHTWDSLAADTHGARPPLRRHPRTAHLPGRHFPRHRPLHRLSLRRLPSAGPNGPARRTRASAPPSPPSSTKTLEAPGTFDRGWLTVGFCGHQPHLGESYISTGSLYLAATALLPLGLPPSHPFWSAAPEDWTQKRIWRGEDLPTDHAL